MPSIVGVSQLIGQRGEQGEPGEPGRPLRVLGSVANIGLLPPDAEFPGDAYVVDGYIYVWDGADWVETFIEAGAAAAGETDGQAVAGIALDNGDGTARETWLGTTRDGGPTAYAITKLEDAGFGAGGAVDSVNGQTGAVVLDATDVGALPDDTAVPSQVYSLIDSPDARTHPTFTKPLTDSILTIPDHPLPTQSWPWLVDMRPSGGSGVTLLFSSDHDSGNPGVYAATAATPLGPYTSVGQIYNDTVSGNQTETPSAVWVPEASLYYLYYHNNGVTPGQQSTVLATSPTLASGSFTRVGVIDPNWTSIMPGDGHDGYFRPFRVGADWYGYSAYDGGDVSLTQMRRSVDGITWYTDPYFLGHQSWFISHLSGYAADWQVDWEHSCVLTWRGRPWVIVGVRDRSNVIGWVLGGGAMRLVAAPLTDDLAGFAARPIDITPTLDQAWEGNQVTYLGNAFAWDGHVYVPYRAGSSAVSVKEHDFGILEVV